MPRTYDPASRVELPRLRAGALVALTRSLLAAAIDPTGQRFPLPAETGNFLGGLDAAQAELQTALGPASSGNDTPETRQADRREDNAVIALRDFLIARGRLEDAKAAEAQVLFDRLFGEDERPVTTLPYEEEWTAVEAKLNLLETDAKKPAGEGERLRERLVAIGGDDFLTHLQSVHVEYGRALGITVHRQAGETPLVLEKKRALIALIREYIVHVSGLNNRYAAAEQKALAATLLGPYVDAKAESKSTSPRQPKTDSGKADPKPSTL